MNVNNDNISRNNISDVSSREVTNIRPKIRT